MTALPDHRANSEALQPTVARAIEVGAALFAEHGYEATTTREVARVLGITNGTFYHHFPSKEALLVRICIEATRRLVAEVSQTIEGLQPSRTTLGTLVEAHLATRNANRDLYVTLLTSERSLSEEHVKLVEDEKEKYRVLLRGVIKGAQEAGIIRADLTPDTLMLALLNLLNYSIFRFAVSESTEIASSPAILTSIFVDGAAAR